MKDYDKLFKKLAQVEPPEGLGGEILVRVKAEEKKLERVRIFVFGGSTVVSFGFSLWTVTYLIGSFQQTGFWQYLSLLFFENGAILTYWRELSLSLAESLPVTGLVITLVSIGFFIWSSANALRNTRIFKFNIN